MVLGTGAGDQQAAVRLGGDRVVGAVAQITGGVGAGAAVDSVGAAPAMNQVVSGAAAEDVVPPPGGHAGWVVAGRFDVLKTSAPPQSMPD